MTSNNSILGTEVPRNVIDNLIHLLWGTKINGDIFQRWNQGFTLLFTLHFRFLIALSLFLAQH